MKASIKTLCTKDSVTKTSAVQRNNGAKQKMNAVIDINRNSLRVVHTKQSYDRMADLDLILACQRGNALASNVLLKRHSPTVMRLICRLAPEWADKSDISQEVLFRIWRALPQLKDPRAFKSWLKKIVTHIFFDELRKRKPTVSLDEPLRNSNGEETICKELPDHSDSPDEVCAKRELMQALHTGMAKLPEHYRTPIILREVNGYSYEQIAATINVENGTVKSRISRAKRRLREFVEPFGDIA
ncbi:MAG: sigma-70 family RNA polymerase sigma factor [Candidatus Obscuribacterales bacterium]|nr:sigma-70 family RNA polymerase sigma factor [Candidatus Obscuribacterales bacterium]